MPDSDEMNLRIVIKTNMIDKMHCGYRTLRTTAVRVWHQVSHRHQQNVNLSRSLTLTCQTLQLTSPVLTTTSRWYEAPLERSKVLSDFARVFSGALQGTCSNGGAFRMIRNFTNRIVKFWRLRGNCEDLWEPSSAAEIYTQLCGRHGTVLSL